MTAGTIDQAENKSGRDIAVEFCEVKLPVNSRIHPGVTLSLP